MAIMYPPEMLPSPDEGAEVDVFIESEWGYFCGFCGSFHPGLNYLKGCIHWESNSHKTEATT